MRRGEVCIKKLVTRNEMSSGLTKKICSTDFGHQNSEEAFVNNTIRARFILKIFLFGNVNGHDDVVSLAGNYTSGEVPSVIFINFFDQFPTEPYPHKTDGATIEIPPDERYLLPSYMTYLIYMVLGSLSLLILLHLLRRRPIDHYEGHEKILYDREEESELSNLRNSRQVDQSKLFYYQKRTNHVATSHKLRSTFGRDFNPDAYGLSDDEYAQRENIIIDKVRLKRGPLDDEEEI